MQASVPARADPDVIGVKMGGKRPLGYPRHSGAGRNPGAPFATKANVAKNLTSLGSGFRRNDARDAVYVDTVKEKSIVALRPKPAFRPMFEVATTKEGGDGGGVLGKGHARYSRCLGWPRWRGREVSGQ